jgi:ATP-dependent Clp protease ATP-binding subunit ClpA
VHNLLLGLLDNGRIANNRGRKIDAKQCIIIMTTNALSLEDIEKKPMGFGTNSIQCADPIELLGKDFPKEFLGRIDKIILLNRLKKDDMRKIMKMRLDEALERLYEEGTTLVFDEKRLLNYLLDGLESTQSGARGIDRVLERKLLQPLSIALLKRDIERKCTVELSDDYYDHGNIKFLS